MLIQKSQGWFRQSTANLNCFSNSGSSPFSFLRSFGLFLKDFLDNPLPGYPVNISTSGNFNLDKPKLKSPHSESLIG